MFAGSRQPKVRDFQKLFKFLPKNTAQNVAWCNLIVYLRFICSIYCFALSEKCPYSELFWCTFPRIQTLNTDRIRTLFTQCWLLHCMLNLNHTTAQKFNFLLRISSVNVIKSAGNCEFDHIYWINPSWKTFLWIILEENIFSSDMFMYILKMSNDKSNETKIRVDISWERYGLSMVNMMSGK